MSRLLEEEGIFYFFEHSDTKHLLVFADGPVAYKEIAGESGVTYNFSQGMAPAEECVYRFAFFAAGALREDDAPGLPTSRSRGWT